MLTTRSPIILPSTFDEYPTAYKNLPNPYNPPAIVEQIGYFTPDTKIKKQIKKACSTKFKWAL